jgi:hypothetical protein
MPIVFLKVSLDICIVKEYHMKITIINPMIDLRI